MTWMLLYFWMGGFRMGPHVEEVRKFDSKETCESVKIQLENKNPGYIFVCEARQEVK